MRKKRTGGPVPLADILQERFRQLGWDHRIREQEILGRWEEAVGPQVAAKARPLYVRNRRLTVAVDNPAWAQQLALLKKDLLRRFDSLLGEGVIKDLFFTSGRIKSSARPESPADKPQEPIRPEVRKAIEEEASHIRDGELRDSFRKTLLAASRRRKAAP